MACPKCGCKETYTYVEDDIIGLPDDQERCAACGHIFFFEDHADEEDDIHPAVALLDALQDRPIEPGGTALIDRCVKLPPNAGSNGPSA